MYRYEVGRSGRAIGHLDPLGCDVTLNYVCSRLANDGVSNVLELHHVETGLSEEMVRLAVVLVERNALPKFVAGGGGSSAINGGRRKSAADLV